MLNIIDYFNTFLEVIFGSFNSNLNVELLDPHITMNILGNWFRQSSTGDLWKFLTYMFNNTDWPSVLLSLFVWSWFAWLTVNLLLIWPFKWLRSVINRCKG